MTFFAFLGALSLSVLAFELLNIFQNAFSTFGGNRLMNFQSQTPVKRRSTWDALLVAVLPGRFDPDQAKNMSDVISLLRRAGYPYDTPGEFYAVAIRDFSIFLAVGGMLAGALAALGMAVAAPFAASSTIPLVATLGALGRERLTLHLALAVHEDAVDRFGRARNQQH